MSIGHFFTNLNLRHNVLQVGNRNIMSGSNVNGEQQGGSNFFDLFSSRIKSSGRDVAGILDTGIAELSAENSVIFGGTNVVADIVSGNTAEVVLDKSTAAIDAHDVTLTANNSEVAVGADILDATVENSNLAAVVSEIGFIDAKNSTVDALGTTLGVQGDNSELNVVAETAVVQANNGSIANVVADNATLELNQSGGTLSANEAFVNVNEGVLVADVENTIDLSINKGVADVVSNGDGILAANESVVVMNTQGTAEVNAVNSDIEVTGTNVVSTQLEGTDAVLHGSNTVVLDNVGDSNNITATGSGIAIVGDGKNNNVTAAGDVVAVAGLDDSTVTVIATEDAGVELDGGIANVVAGNNATVQINDANQTGGVNFVSTTANHGNVTLNNAGLSAVQMNAFGQGASNQLTLNGDNAAAIGMFASDGGNFAYHVGTAQTNNAQITLTQTTTGNNGANVFGAGDLALIAQFLQNWGIGLATA